MTTIKKLIVTNRSALAKKYGAAGWTAVQQALTRLRTADTKRGFTTILALLDAPAAGVPKVKSASSARETKRAIDALYKKYAAPDYVLILGGTDVVPHSVLKNPIVAGEDEDPDLPSDLPYACEAPYSTDVSDFVGPTRVVGRLPDIRGSNEVKDFIKLIDAAAKFSGTTGSAHFVISAAIWRGATQANAALAFGGTPTPEVVPPKGPGWPTPDLGAPLHFINCHGADKDPNYYGQPANGARVYPDAHSPANLTGTVSAGAVVAAECCFGSQLYHPTGPLVLGISTTYLLEGAIAFLGSTNTAYGESTAAKRCKADVLCTDFMGAIMKLATTGRALLEARQEYVKKAGILDPFDLKTLGQFLLLGDPSARPYSALPSHAGAPAPKSKTVMSAAHKARRHMLKMDGTRLGRDTPFAMKASRALPTNTRASLEQIAAQEELAIGKTLRFEIAPGRADVKAKSDPKRKSKAKPKDSFQVMFERAQPKPKTSSVMPAIRAVAAGEALILEGLQVTDSGPPAPQVKEIRAVIARTRDENVLSYSTVASKSLAWREAKSPHEEVFRKSGTKALLERL